MTTEKLYDSEPYSTDFTARVVSVDGNKVILDRTLFFPEEGGQTCDGGYVAVGDDERKVTDVQISDSCIIHTLEDASGIKEGDEVSGHIDWEHRFDNMQNHTGEHIFSGIVHSLKGYDNVGFSLTENTCQMDYNGKLSDQEIADIERKANEVIWKALPVDCRYPSDKELSSMDYRSKKELTGAVRIVTIPGVDVCACCAPHVKTTAEVGILKVLSHINYKGGTRLYIACGKRAYAEFVQAFDALTDTGHLFSTGRADAYDAVKKLINDRDALKGQLSSFEKDELIKQIDETDGDTIFTKVTDRNILTAAFNHFKEVHDGACYIFSEKEDGSYTFLAGGRGLDARTLLPLLKEKYTVRGGGNAEMIQGSANFIKNS